MSVSTKVSLCRKTVFVSRSAAGRLASARSLLACHRYRGSGRIRVLSGERDGPPAIAARVPAPVGVDEVYVAVDGFDDLASPLGHYRFPLPTGRHH